MLPPSESADDADPPRPLRAGAVFERLWLRRADGRLTLSSRGPVARWLLPAINTLPALCLLPAAAAWALIGWGLMNPTPAAPPPAAGVAVVMVAMVLAGGLLPLLLILSLLAWCGVGRGVAIELDADRQRCRVRRSRLGLPAAIIACELADASITLRRRTAVGGGPEGRRGAPGRARSIGSGLLIVLALINPLFLILSLAMGRRRSAVDPANPRPTFALDVTADGHQPFGRRLVCAGQAASAAEAFVAAWERARRERFRSGFEPAAGARAGLHEAPAPSRAR
ncbi:hypothetical protein [Phycisphaera mikurensis]|uniref:Uncharacterized protein n=1 Tax=Phycisphaera mikurensis (strain NBRC 102666 / KCTC 22515 / FYK2301M01) TaxID=1142394 RepID=I0IHI1_PHYMF|nr:hypothetical protein [Phycisphaera mikurensis]MBB6440965.1 hypothetical protein [Phycisphaera mikurensis]BAM04719.1 hypothetical protein PSMK_25600 [Phycisphaera mikurensis NBRC 102666]